MVSTRHHPQEFPAPESSPSKSSPRKASSRVSTSSPAPASPNGNGMASYTTTLTQRATSSSLSASSASRTATKGWSHTASNITIAWIAISLPLQIWDTLYILLRPHTMAGGALQWPIWKPYELYAETDYIYGWPGWNRNDGFGGAQGAMNFIETILYGLYLLIVLNHGVPSAGGRGVQIGEGVSGWIAGGRRVAGKTGSRALVIGFGAAVMTLSKTVLYFLNEYFSHFENVKHNDVVRLVFLYCILNGLWVLFPAYMTVVFGTDLLEGLDLATESASAESKKKY